jgi:formate dehydrogenase assembly factor FdhD
MIESDPHQQLMFAVWSNALNDINRGFLLDSGVINITDEEKAAEIRENAKESIDWITEEGHPTFELAAYIHNIAVDKFRRKTLEVIEKNKQLILRRSKTTNQYMYATVSRFRNYEEAFQRTGVPSHITVS